MASRTRGLWWKEWRQLRMLRVGGALMIVVAPAMLLSAAEASRRGWLPLGGLQAYSATTVVQDALPMFLGYLIWPLLALMLVAQSFCGDIAAGTEWFWKERPVRPRRIWTTRLLASLSSLIAIIALHWVGWKLLVAVWGDPGSLDAVGKPTRWFLMGQLSTTEAGAAMFMGLFAALAAFVAALAASALARSPMQALPLGLILAALPLGLGQLLAAGFPYARAGNFNMASAAALLLFVAYVIASYRSACRGEPAGRGKLVRGLSVLGVGLFAVVALGLPTGFWVSHRAELVALVNSSVVASPAGDRLFIFNDRQGSAWLFDVDSGEELLHLRPWVFEAAWNADGERLAVARISEAGNTVAEVYDRDGARLVEALDCRHCYDIAWAGERLAVSTYRDHGWGIDWVDPSTGERSAAELEPADRPFELIGPGKSGTTYLAQQIHVTGNPDVDPTGRSTEGKVLLYAVGLDSDPIGEPITVDGINRGYRFGTLAPDGSAVLTEGLREVFVIDLAGGPLKQIGWSPAWLRPNRPVWTRRDGEDLAILVDEEGTVRELGQFDGHGAVDLSGSPDGQRLLLVRSPNVSSPGGLQALQHWLYEDETQSWTELEQTKLNDRNGWPAQVEWVNNETIVLRGAGVLALCEPGVPGSLRYLKGG